jgi:hypothetical protein
MAHYYEINDDILENYKRKGAFMATSTRKNKSRGQRH